MQLRLNNNFIALNDVGMVEDIRLKNFPSNFTPINGS